MLLGEVVSGELYSLQYYRQITRLGGNFTTGGLAPESMERTLSALREFARILKQQDPEAVRLVGTAALRRARNQDEFISRVARETGLRLDVIDGDEEARTSASGVLSVIDPLPETSLIVDIGGGSTEFILCHGNEVLYQISFPLGVVQLCEESASARGRNLQIDAVLCRLRDATTTAGYSDLLTNGCQLIGTAGTLTTLAAMQLQMGSYDWRRINNQHLSTAWLQKTLDMLLPMPLSERAALPGLEEGRADLIIPGLEILLAVCRFLSVGGCRVSDSGLLEGLLLRLAPRREMI
jgi:exopolyphosphatase/guanosine-5'-triphosphate,3'-diphosphate pyrophosphatase